MDLKRYVSVSRRVLRFGRGPAGAGSARPNPDRVAPEASMRGTYSCEAMELLPGKRFVIRHSGVPMETELRKSQRHQALTRSTVGEIACDQISR